MFINISNHPSSNWFAAQANAAKEYGEIVDVVFPIIEAQSTSSEVASLADQFASDIVTKYNSTTDVVHIMGEMTFTYALVKRLREAGFRCVASTTERVKQQLPDGSFISEFRFQSFRDYE